VLKAIEKPIQVDAKRLKDAALVNESYRAGHVGLQWRVHVGLQ